MLVGVAGCGPSAARALVGVVRPAPWVAGDAGGAAVGVRRPDDVDAELVVVRLMETGRRGAAAGVVAAVDADALFSAVELPDVVRDRRLSDLTDDDDAVGGRDVEDGVASFDAAVDNDAEPRRSSEAPDVVPARPPDAEEDDLEDVCCDDGPPDVAGVRDDVGLTITVASRSAGDDFVREIVAVDAPGVADVLDAEEEVGAA